MTHRRTLSVEGLCCRGCELGVEQALLDVDAVEKVRADAASDAVEVVCATDTPDDVLVAVVDEAGFAVRSVE